MCNYIINERQCQSENCRSSPILSSTSSSDLKIRDIAKILQNKETKLDAWTLRVHVAGQIMSNVKCTN